MVMKWLKKKWVTNLTSWLVAIGAVNWGLVQWFNFNLVTAWLSGMMVTLVYTLVGIAGVVMLLKLVKLVK